MPDPYCESGLPKLTKENRYLGEMVVEMMVEMMMVEMMMVKMMMVEIINLNSGDDDAED